VSPHAEQMAVPTSRQIAWPQAWSVDVIVPRKPSNNKTSNTLNKTASLLNLSLSLQAVNKGMDSGNSCH
jgi:hypothetical protein